MERSRLPFGDHVTDEQIAQLESLLPTMPDEAAAFAALGQSLGASATGEDPERRGRAVFSRRLAELRKSLCNQPTLIAYSSNANTSDATSVAAAVLGTLVSTHFAGINVVVVAALIGRIGLRKLCESTWK